MNRYSIVSFMFCIGSWIGSASSQTVAESDAEQSDYLPCIGHWEIVTLMQGGSIGFPIAGDGKMTGVRISENEVECCGEPYERSPWFDNSDMKLDWKAISIKGGRSPNAFKIHIMSRRKVADGVLPAEWEKMEVMLISVSGDNAIVRYSDHPKIDFNDFNFGELSREEHGAQWFWTLRRKPEKK